jgi:hypothetical protein
VAEVVPGGQLFSSSHAVLPSALAMKSMPMNSKSLAERWHSIIGAATRTCVMIVMRQIRVQRSAAVRLL